MVHLYDEDEFLCDVVDDCFDVLAKRFGNEKLVFCKIRARDLGSSAAFVGSAVPTIQCYEAEKRRVLALGSVVKPEIVEYLGEDFTTDDLLRFLRNNFNL